MSLLQQKDAMYYHPVPSLTSAVVRGSIAAGWRVAQALREVSAGFFDVGLVYGLDQNQIDKVIRDEAEEERLAALNQQLILAADKQTGGVFLARLVEYLSLTEVYILSRINPAFNSHFHKRGVWRHYAIHTLGQTGFDYYEAIVRLVLKGDKKKINYFWLLVAALPQLMPLFFSEDGRYSWTVSDISCIVYSKVVSARSPPMQAMLAVFDDFSIVSTPPKKAPIPNRIFRVIDAMIDENRDEFHEWGWVTQLVADHEKPNARFMLTYLSLLLSKREGVLQASNLGIHSEAF